MIGDLINHRYKIISRISDEHLYTCYKCDDLISIRTVAAYVLQPQYASNSTFINYVMEDAKALESIIYPGIVRVLDHGEDNGNYYVITEFVKGVTLEEHIKKNAPFPQSTAIDIAAAICSILDYMHSQGFIHADLKPSNIIVTPDGHIKVANYWLSSAISSVQALRTANLAHSIHYMPPEAINGEPITHASDIYSLGIILFQLLTGKLPYEGDMPSLVAEKHLREPIPYVRSFNPNISREIEGIVYKAMQKLPSSRYRSAKAMLRDLISERNRGNEPPIIDETVVSRKNGKEDYEEYEVSPMLLSIRRILLTLVLIIIIVGVGIGTYIYTKPSYVVVPDLIGKTYSEAADIAARAGLKITTKMEEYNEEFPAGTIYFMAPVTGRTAKRGSTIEVWVSKGSRYVIVPDLENLPIEEAQRKVTEADLAIGDLKEEYSDTVPMGNVIRQRPKAGLRVERGTKVDIIYSLGPKIEEEPANSINETPESIENNVSHPSGKTRSFDVKFTVPPGNESQNVEIAVVDDYGENIVFSRMSAPGDAIEQTVQGTGDKIKIRIYIDGKLVKEEVR